MASHHVLLVGLQNAGNIGHRVPFARALHDHLGGACNMLLVGYRGYGSNKQHDPTEPGLMCV